MNTDLTLQILRILYCVFIGTDNTAGQSAKGMQTSGCQVLCTTRINIVSLSPFDSKRWIARNGVDTLACGHIDIESRTPNSNDSSIGLTSNVFGVQVTVENI